MTKRKKGRDGKFQEMMESTRMDTPERLEAATSSIVEDALHRSIREVDEPTTLQELEEAEERQRQRRLTGKRTISSPLQLRGASTKSKVVRALSLLGRQSLAVKIHKCEPRARCSSFYCEYCRDRAAKNLVARVERRVSIALGGNAAAVQKRFRFLTVLHEVVDFDSTAVSVSVERCRAGMNAFHRSFPDVWLQGAFEFELIDVDHLNSIRSGNGKTKSETVRSMMAQDSSQSGLMVLVHFHAIMDLMDEDAADVSRWLKARWNAHPRQIDAKVTHSRQRLEDKIWKLSSYCFKNRTQFNDTFETRDFEFGKDFTYEQLGRLVCLYQDFLDAGSGSIRGLYISHGNRS